MARRALGPAALQVTAAIDPWLRAATGEVAVACSGGPDSLALMAGAAWVAERADPERLAVRVVTIDHGLQPGSAEVCAQVVAQAAGLNLPARVIQVTCDPGDPRGPEAAARAARLDALEADGADQILLGHTLDDQAETVLLGLARGSGARSLSGMRTQRGRFLRPLLALTRTVTEQACREWNLQAWRDPHNDDARFLRSRVRAEVMPVLSEVLGPGTIAALARSADLLRADADALDRWAAEHLVTGPEASISGLSDLPPAVMTRVLRAWLVARGASEPSADQVGAVVALVTDWHGQGPIHLAGIQVTRHQGQLVTQPHPRH